MQPIVVLTATTAPSSEAISTSFRSRSISSLNGVPSSEAGTTSVTTLIAFASRQQEAKCG